MLGSRVSIHAGFRWCEFCVPSTPTTKLFTSVCSLCCGGQDSLPQMFGTRVRVNKTGFRFFPLTRKAVKI